nr:MAG TPA: hypothetical protein [Caudoviricetes sp.]
MIQSIRMSKFWYSFLLKNQKGGIKHGYFW